MRALTPLPVAGRDPRPNRSPEGSMAKKKKTAKKKSAPAKRPAKRSAAKKKAPRKAVMKKAAPKTTKRTPKKPAGPRVHSVVHWEIQSQAPERLHRFYADAL